MRGVEDVRSADSDNCSENVRLSTKGPTSAEYNSFSRSVGKREKRTTRMLICGDDVVLLCREPGVRHLMRIPVEWTILREVLCGKVD